MSAEAQRLDECEGGARRPLETKLGLARAEACPSIIAPAQCRLVRRGHIADAQSWREQAGELGAMQLGAKRRVFDRQPEEASKTNGLHRGARGLESAPKGLRAHVDAEHDLGGRCRDGKVGSRPAQPLD